MGIFFYGKELAPILGPRIPPDPAALHWQAVRIGAEATWSAGLIIGVVLLLANNPSRSRPQLRYGQLLCRIPVIFAITAFSGLILGFAGQQFWLNWISPDFRDLAQGDSWRPHRFMTVYGMHLGGYIGGLVGTMWSAIAVHRERRKLSPT